MKNKNIYIYKNQSNIKQNVMMYFAMLFAIIVLITKQSFLLAFLTLIIFILVHIFVMKIALSANSIHYSEIIVDNFNKKLIFRFDTEYNETYNYNEIKKICFSRRYIISKNAIIRTIKIFQTNGNSPEIDINNYEFSLNFLKKLPNNIRVVEEKPTTSLVSKLCYGIVIVMWIVVFLYIIALNLKF